MSKSLYQGLILASLFIVTWLGFKQVNWMHLLNVESISKKSNEKLGDVFWEMYSKQFTSLKNEYVNTAVDSLKLKLCKANKINLDNLKIHIVKSDEINAFALPGGHIILHTALIQACKNPEELFGVMAHEIAHVELQHIRSKLIKEFGIAVLINSSTDGVGADVIAEGIKKLSSTAYDRSLEKDADLEALKYMSQAKVDPNNLANFLFNLAEADSEYSTFLSWVSTHPELLERSNYIAENSSVIAKPQQLISLNTWQKLQSLAFSVK